MIRVDQNIQRNIMFIFRKGIYPIFTVFQKTAQLLQQCKYGFVCHHLKLTSFPYTILTDHVAEMMDLFQQVFI